MNEWQGRNAAFKVLIVDDEVSSREAIEDVLSKRYSTMSAADGEGAVRIARSNKPDLILLDIMMASMDGIAVCQALRQDKVTCHIPIIMITGADDVESRVEAFHAGADDYLVKPFKPRELMARVFSKLRRIEERTLSDSLLNCGNILLDLNRMEIKVNDRNIFFSVLEFELLKCFMRNKNRVLTREEILSEVWNGSVVCYRTVDTHVVSLRKKLAGGDHQVSTVYGAGYILKQVEALSESQ